MRLLYPSYEIPFLFYSIIFLFLSFAQRKTGGNPLPKYDAAVTYDSYKNLKNDKTRKIDSLGFLVVKNDTLIFITGYKQPQGIKVAYERKDPAFLAIYKEIVYNKSNQKPNSTSKPTMKIWKDEIKVYFDSTVTSSQKREMTKFFKYLDMEVDSLKISVVHKKEKSNYFIYCINKPTDINWENRITTNDGYYILWNVRQRIYNASLKLDTQKVFNEKQQLMILKKNFIQTLGNFYLQNNRDCKSFLSSCSTMDKEVTKEDLEILKYHYSYGICKGTDLKTFEENHKDAQELLAKHPDYKFTFTHVE
ncbi:hypothetical protein [Flavobacterium sp. GT3R68]|uniref:hypothetical protein n=1 Tax=Flavobacterium sp. GT3R68 TaxID=2594437 RepID=UPI000F85B959|nr:hypothetical protein [Flavobacterium sp. GT3R68]RTY90588.1 hypothetical protein EKL32_20415 [Flavobacterium sp. GSN2]TRW89886.1 hypothetical protein FNW07_12650 [Flavobacterium sp. GT3R68]